MNKIDVSTDSNKSKKLKKNNLNYSTNNSDSESDYMYETPSDSDYTLSSDDDLEEEKKLTDNTKKLNDEIKNFYQSVHMNRVDIDKIKNWKHNYSDEQINDMALTMNTYNANMSDKEIGLIKILEKDISIDEKLKILELYEKLIYIEPFTDEYISISNHIYKLLNLTEQDKYLHNKINDLSPSMSLQDQILNSNMNDHNLSIVYNKCKKLENANFSSDSGKLKEWVHSILQVPFGKYITPPSLNSQLEIANYLQQIRTDLDKNISYLEKPKDEIINYIAKTIHNPNSKSINAISIYGSPGIGKTSLVREGIAKALNRPFVSIPLGGAKDSSFLLGHGYTYEGSKCGRIIDILKQTKCMNPIIYFDELDKISDTSYGQEIIGVLTHLIDTTQNTEFYDHYFEGIQFDLSNVLFIFSYNNENLLDYILSDRINKIKVDDPSITQKIHIAKQHLLPSILKDLDLIPSDISINDETLEYLITSYTNETGCRELKRHLSHIITRLNTLNMCGNYKHDIIKLNYNTINSTFPVNITKDIIQTLIKNTKDKTSHSHMYI